MMWSNSVRSILKGWLGVTPGDDSVLRRSSAITTGVSLEPPPPPEAEVVQGSKSYMEVSMSAKRMSSRARSVRKPEEAQEDGEEELQAEGEELMSSSAGAGSVSIATVSGFGLQTLTQSLESEPDRAREGTRAGARVSVG